MDAFTNTRKVLKDDVVMIEETEQVYELQMEKLQKLEEENRQLRVMVEQDWLTGIYNRGTIELKINQQLQMYQKGALFVLDVDHFKQINDQYGHICGDVALKKIAAVLKKITYKNGSAGRVGGDEFVIFYPEADDESFIEEKRKEIRSLLKQIQVTDGASIYVSICGCMYRPNDDYISMFRRADALLVKEKHIRRRLDGEHVYNDIYMSENLLVDIELIRKELREQEIIPGAFCQDYHSFQNIYRFIERRMSRIQGEAGLILFTLMNPKGAYPSFEQQEQCMFALKRIIQSSLRLGDVFTQYSSFQFLVMALDTKEEGIQCIIDRIQKAFAQNACLKDKMLLHHDFPLEAVHTHVAR